MVSSIYKYSCELKRVVDGDTIDVIAHLGFQLTATMRLRFAGLNTPEIRGVERPEGLLAKSYVEEKLQNASAIGIITYKTGKYGRYIADIFYTTDTELSWYDIFESGTNLNKELIEKGFAEEVSW